MSEIGKLERPQEIVGAYVKVLSSGRALHVELVNGGRLVECSLFELGEQWGGHWKLRGREDRAVLSLNPPMS